MIRNHRTRIVATLGPSSREPAMVEAMARAGADVFRLNFSHGSHADHAASAAAVRAAEIQIGRPLALLGDLQGPKLRLGVFAAGKVTLPTGGVYRLDLDPTPGDEARAPLLHPEIFAALKVGDALLIDDGRVRFKMRERDTSGAHFDVVQGGVISDRKGVNVPGAVLALSALTDKDHKDLAFALELGVDWVALSFVQQEADMAALKRLLNGRAAAMAKIEKPQALARLSEILDYCDGVMVARGDLGVELQPEEVPVAQKQILRAARRRGVPAIVATQMLESMIGAPTPTRAEASDVANAVYEGADALMLSGESAAGLYPLEAVAMMARIMDRVETDPLWPSLMDAEHAAMEDNDVDALSAAAKRTADAIRPGCLVAWTSGGATARRLSRERPLQPVLAITSDMAVARKLALGWGLEPRVLDQPSNLDEMSERAGQLAVSLGLAKPGQRLVIVAGVPFGTPGSTNLLRLAYAPT